MTLGNYKSTPVYFNGVCVGSNESSEDIRVGKHCTGATYDGESVGRFSIDLDDLDSPEMVVTDIQGKYIFSSEGLASLEDWEKLFEDTLTHIRSLKSA